jgi:RNA polymerase sigma-70 factor (family 1)
MPVSSSVYTLFNEKHLFFRMSEGDEVAFEKIFHHYNARIYPFILKRTKSVGIAEDIVQELFLKLWHNRQELLAIDNYESYIYTMAINMVYNHFRKLASETRMLNELWQTMDEFRNTTEEDFEYKESETLIIQAVEQLAPQCKKIYLLSREQGLSHEQIAQELNISRSTVNNQITKALHFIREYIQKNADSSLPIIVLLLKILT